MSTRHRRELAALRGVVVLVAGFLVLATTAVPASAQYGSTITGCGQKCQTGGCGPDTTCRTASNGKCTLGGNLNCTSGQSTLQMIDGTDLDMTGYDITCTSGLCNYPAVTFFNANSKVITSLAGSAISGPFVGGVACGSTSGSIVEEITVANTSGYGVANCQTVRNVVVDMQGSGTYGIIVGGTGSNDSVTDNYVTGVTYPIATTTTQSVDILHNVINTAGASSAFLLLTGTANGNTKYNILFGANSVFTAAGTDNTVYDGNYCDPTQSNCTSCISGGKCESYIAPFLGN